MAKYKCIASGNVIEFTNQVDIDSMVGHEGYIKLEEQEVVKTSKKAKAVVATEAETTSKEAE
jgi:DNA-binding transcriptional regulator YhcF (GntR family)